jgi:hypothetical protein
VARRLEVPRQKVNYHLRALESEGLVELVEERKKGNCVERLVRATARSYLVGAEALGALASDPTAVVDRFSSAYLVAAAARTLTEVSEQRARAAEAQQRLPTFTIETEVRFSSAAARAAYFEDLTNVLARLSAKHHDAEASGGRSFRLLVAAHPAIPNKE